MGVIDNAISYEADGYGWAMEQAALLREGRVSEADIGNIAQELADMGGSLRGELVNRLSVLLCHLLKWRFQPSHRGYRWRLTIIEQRRRLDEHLEDNPSLKRLVPASVTKGYGYGSLSALRETGVSEDLLPKTCPWTEPEIFSEEFLPE